MATANANAAPGATRPVDQHVEFVVKVILFCRRRNAGGMGHCASKRSLSLSSRCPVSPIVFRSIHASSFCALFSQVSCLGQRGSDCPDLEWFLSRAVGCSAVQAQADASARIRSGRSLAYPPKSLKRRSILAALSYNLVPLLLPLFHILSPLNSQSRLLFFAIPVYIARAERRSNSRTQARPRARFISTKPLS